MGKKNNDLKKLLDPTPIKKILHMPEDKDNAPHWLYWLFLSMATVVVVMGLWFWLSDTGRLDPYMSYFQIFGS